MDESGAETMTAAEMKLIESEIDRIERWRAEELERAGYGPEHAFELAMRHEVDLHLAVDLLRSGCSPELAAQILL